MSLDDEMRNQAANAGDMDAFYAALDADTKDARIAELEQRDLIIGSRLDDALAKNAKLEALLGECKPSVIFHGNCEAQDVHPAAGQEYFDLLDRIEAALGEVEGE